MRNVIIDIDCYTLEGTISADADLDGTFRLTEADGTVLQVNGWLIDNIEDLD